MQIYLTFKESNVLKSTMPQIKFTEKIFRLFISTQTVLFLTIIH